MSNPDLLEALKQRGAEVFQVPIYRWALPEDLGPLRQALDEVIAGKVAVLLITNAAQVDHVMQVLEQDGNVEFMRRARRWSSRPSAPPPTNASASTTSRGPRTFPLEDGCPGQRSQRAVSRPSSAETISLDWYVLVWLSVSQWRSIHILLDRLREDKHAGSRIASGFQFLQSAIGIGEGERQGAGFDRNRSRLAQEIEAVLLRIGRDASNDPLSKDLAIVVERGNRRHVNTGEGERAAAFQ